MMFRLSEVSLLPVHAQVRWWDDLWRWWWLWSKAPPCITWAGCYIAPYPVCATGWLVVVIRPFSSALGLNWNHTSAISLYSSMPGAPAQSTDLLLASHLGDPTWAEEDGTAIVAPAVLDVHSTPVSVLSVDGRA